MKIWLLPIERIDMRYSTDWLNWWVEFLNNKGVEYTVVDGDVTTNPDTTVNFLDFVRTWQFKGVQMAFLAKYWNDVEDGDVFILHDAWGPAAMAINYMRMMTNKKVTIAGYFHAGFFDQWDRISLWPTKTQKWGKPAEQAMASCLDVGLFGSAYAKALMFDFVGNEFMPTRSVPVGLPIKQMPLKKWRTIFDEREYDVVFPHRLAIEKDPFFFDEVMRYVQQRWKPNLKWIKTAEQPLESKDDFYRILGNSKVAFSSSKQETFGIAMQEASAVGCQLVAPADLAYPDVCDGAFLYERNIVNAAVAVVKALDKGGPGIFNDHHETAIDRAWDAIMGFRGTYQNES